MPGIDEEGKNIPGIDEGGAGYTWNRWRRSWGNVEWRMTTPGRAGLGGQKGS